MLPSEPTDFAALAQVLKALADPTRLRIVALVADEELCVCDIECALDLPQPTISRHLATLRNAEVLTARRDGRWMYYRRAPQADLASEKVLTALLEVSAPERSADLERLRRTKGGNPCC